MALGIELILAILFILPPPQLPDLVIRDFEVRPVEVAGRTYIQVTGELVNVGGAVASWAGVGVRLEGYSYVYTSQQNLGPGAHFLFRWWFAPPPGFWRVEARADPYGYVTESNERNNERHRHLHI